MTSVAPKAPAPSSEVVGTRAVTVAAEPLVSVAAEPLQSEDAIRLRASLTAELGLRYGEESEPGPEPTSKDTPVFLIARDRAGEPLGCASLRWLSPRTLEIKHVYVKPTARGRGVARELLHRLEEHALRLGARRVVLEAGPRQPEAIALYESRSYRRIRRLGGLPGSRRSYCYVRTLAPGQAGRGPATPPQRPATPPQRPALQPQRPAPIDRTGGRRRRGWAASGKRRWHDPEAWPAGI